MFVVPWCFFSVLGWNKSCDLISVLIWTFQIVLLCSLELAQMAERPLFMREVLRSIPGFSKLLFCVLNNRTRCDDRSLSPGSYWLRSNAGGFQWTNQNSLSNIKCCTLYVTISTSLREQWRTRLLLSCW